MAGYSRVGPPRTRPHDNNDDLFSLYSRPSIQNSSHWPSDELHSPGPSVWTLNQSDGGTYRDDISLANFSTGRDDIDPSVRRGSVFTANMSASPSSNRPNAPSGGFRGQYQHLPVSLEKSGESRGSGGSTQSWPTPSIRADKRPYQPALPPLVLSSRESTIRSTVFQDDSPYPSVPSVSSLIDNVIEDLPRLSVSTDTVQVPPLQSTPNGEHSSESHQLISTNDTAMLCHFCGLLIEGAFVGTLWTTSKFHLQCFKFRSTGGHVDHESIPQVTEVTLRETQSGVASAEERVELWRYNTNLVFKTGEAMNSDSMFTGEVTCSVPFTTTDGRALVAVGCAEGVWIGFRHDSRSMRRALHLKMVTQCGVLEGFGIFLVLADKSLFAYGMEELVSTSPQRVNTTQTPQKLNSSSDVLFFRVGSFDGRTFVIYMKKRGSDSVFRVLAPVVDKITENAKAPVFLSSRFGLRPPCEEWFRAYRDFLLPTEGHDPPELIVSIVLYLSLHDITSFQRACHKLCDVCNDTTLRYLVQMERSGVSDDLRPGLSYAERLVVLQRREEAWANLDFHKNVQVTDLFEQSSIFDFSAFTGGAFLLSTRLHSRLAAIRPPIIGYSYVTLPSLTGTEDPKLEWRRLNLGIQILDVGLAVHEHDLIAALTATPDKNGLIGGHDTLEIRFLSFSTGQPHPLAEQPIIFIASISLIFALPNFLIHIVGDYLALLITFPLVRDDGVNMFFLVRWKKGEAHCLRSSERGAYAYFSFLTEDTLVIPNLLQNNLEIVRIVVDESDDDVPRLVPLCTLNLPPLAEHASIVHLICRAEPNPTGSGPGPLLVPAPSSRPFRDTAADAIVLFNLLIKYVNPKAAYSSHDSETHPFTFIIHRRALVAHIPRAQLACAPFRSVPGAAPTVVLWDAWGIPVTRWFEYDPASIRWTMSTAGQRAVTMKNLALSPIIVRDFNPHAVRAALAREKSRVLPNGNRQAVKIEEDVIPAGSMFREDVRSALPYIKTVTQTRYGYGGVLIDEERILGLETSKDHKILISFHVHVLG